MMRSSHESEELGYGEVSPFVRLLGTPGRVQVLDIFLRQPHSELSVSEVAELADISTSTFHRNIDEIQELGIVTEVGERSNTTYYKLNRENPVAKVLGKAYQELNKYQAEVLENTDPDEFDYRKWALKRSQRHAREASGQKFKIPSDQPLR
jgi:DNA-binding transcriptional ArsR family regulator